MSYDTEIFDPEDWKTLLRAILRQAMDDYVKLQHPSFRKKKYLQEAFDNAVAMVFDESFRFKAPGLNNDDGDDMSFQDFCQELMSNRVNLDSMRQYLIQDAKEFWENKEIKTLYIPESFIYDGHVYSIFHSEEEPTIDFEDKLIYCNKRATNSDNQLEFMKLATQVMLYHEELAMKGADVEQLGKALFRMLKVNSCFTGH